MPLRDQRGSLCVEFNRAGARLFVLSSETDDGGSLGPAKSKFASMTAAASAAAPEESESSMMRKKPAVTLARAFKV